MRETDATLTSLAQLKEAEGDRVEVGASLYSEPLKHGILRRVKRSLGPVAGLTATLAAAAGGLALAGLASPLLAVGLVAALPVALLGGLAGSEVRDHTTRPHPVPEGLSIQHSKLQTEYPALNEHSGPHEALRETALTNLRTYPAAFHVVHLNGHGFGAQAVAGMPGDKTAQALHAATAGAQRKFDIAVFESCLNGNFEQLNAAADSVNYAVAFEDQVPKSNSQAGRIPLEKMLEEAADSNSARDATVAMARTAGEFFERDEEAAIGAVPWDQRSKPVNKEALWTNPDTTVGAFDLKTLREELNPALGKLGAGLSEAVKSSPQMRNAVATARRKNQVESSGDLIDLGGFLKDLRSATPGESGADIDAALKALGKTTLHLRTGKTLPMSGLSFHSKPHHMKLSNPSSDAYGEGNLPKGWTDFVERCLG